MDLGQKDWNKLKEGLSSFFSKGWLNKLGKSSRFVQRSTSRLGGWEFLLLNVFNTGSPMSLNEHCDWLEEHFSISMSKQSLDERYNTYAVAFMKSCFEQLLEKVNEELIEQLPAMSFECIQLTDSTSFKIPDQLAPFYKGYEGKGGEAMIKLHLNYDLQTGSIADIAIGDACKHDSSYNLEASEAFVKQGLYLRDLGYYSFDYFRQIVEADAYFLSRAKTNATFYQKNAQGAYEKLDLSSLLPKKGQTCELPEVYLGSYKDKLAVRLILQAVPQEVAKQRLEKLATYALKQKDKKVSPQRKAMCHFNMFITNVPSEKIAAEKIRLVYSLRWQIELLFKTWKSYYEIDKIQKMNIFRFECMLYARLIAILIDFSIQNQVRPFFMEQLDIELSPIKAAKFIKKNSLI